MTEEVKEEPVKEEVKEETKPTAIEVAEKLHEQIKAENDRHESLLERDEKLKAEKMLGGESEAGKPSEEPKDPEQVIKDRCNEQLKELGMKI